MARTFQQEATAQILSHPKLLFIGLVMVCIASFTNGNPMASNYGGIDVEEFNKDLPQEISSHLVGDVYVENDDNNNNALSHPYDTQGAPLKKWEEKRWPNGVVHYVFTDTGFTTQEKSLIQSGLRDIETAAPCIRFIEYEEGDSRLPNTYIQVIKGQGCWSLIGRTSSGKPQKLSLNDYCITEDKGTIVHEFLHSLGFYHEQARPDRDEYIHIYWDRLSDGAEPNFRKTDRSDDLGVPYDAESVMHYPNTAYAKKWGTVTMEWKADPSKVLGGIKLTAKDKLQLNRLYCNGVVPPKTTTTTTTTKPTTTTMKPTTTTMKPTTTTMEPTTTTMKPTTTTIKPTTTTMKPTTTTTMEPKTTTDSGKACGDRMWPNCMRAQPNSCSKSMSEACPRSCGVCTGPRSESCSNYTNTHGDSYCQGLGGQGKCRDTNHWRRYTMKRGCTKVCCERAELNTYSG